MAYRRAIFVKQLPLVDCFVKHLIHYRAIRSKITQYKPRSPFWGDTCDAHLLQAVNYWCMVFGSHGCNPTHWKNLATGDIEDLNKSFLSGLVAALEISQSEWTSYWREIVNFRNKFAMHREPGFHKPVPVLDLALKTAYYYDEWVRDVIRPDVLNEAPLRDLAEELKKNIELEIVAALNATCNNAAGSLQVPPSCEHH
jgi:hypothetical protein